MRGLGLKSRLVKIVAIGSMLLAAQTSVAQFISDPYDPWNAAYRSFIYPLAPTNPGIGNQARHYVFEGVSPSHPYAPFNPDDPFGRNSGTGGRFMPYYQSYRGLDETFGRTYKANANDTFFEKQDERQKLYFEALRESDPRKRAELMKQLEDAKRKSVRESSAAQKKKPSSRTANAKAATTRLPDNDVAARGGAAKPDPNLLDAPTPNDLLRAPTPIGRSSSDAASRRSRTADRQLERRRSQAEAAKTNTSTPPAP